MIKVVQSSPTTKQAVGQMSPGGVKTYFKVPGQPDTSAQVTTMFITLIHSMATNLFEEHADFLDFIDVLHRSYSFEHRPPSCLQFCQILAPLAHPKPAALFRSSASYIGDPCFYSQRRKLLDDVQFPPVILKLLYSVFYLRCFFSLNYRYLV